MDANELEDRLLNFGVRCSLLCRELPVKEYFDARHVANQLLRASTHAGFHYPEARAAESTRDFLHKIKVLLKELREAKAELKYCDQMQYFEEGKLDLILQEADELVAIFTATVKKLERKR
ncbi:MAG: four helix bundle protein [Bacteroidota bacterium]